MAARRKTKKPAGVEQWLATAPRTTRCATCNHRPLKDGLNAAEEIRRFLEVQAAGGTDMTRDGFFQRFLKPHGYKPSIHALNNHLRCCEPELYAKVKARR